MNLAEIWEKFQSYEGEGSQSYPFSGGRAQFYKAAMEIPLIALYPSEPFDLNLARMDQFSKVLNSIGLELDCVEDARNYKLNRSEDGQYVGRVTPEAIKLHATRIKQMGWDSFNKITELYFHG